MATVEEVELERWSPSRDVAIAWLAIAAVAFFPLVTAFGALGMLADDESATVRMEGGSFVGLMLALAGILALHEAVHAAGVALLGHRPIFGAGLLHGMPYLSTSANAVFRRDEFVAIALAPLVLISLAGIAVLRIVPGSSWLVLPLAANAVGAVGDLTLTAVVLRYRRGVRIRDERTGITVLGRPADAPAPSQWRLRDHLPLYLFLRTLPLAVVCALFAPLVLLFALRAAGVPALEIPGVLSVDDGPPPTFALNFVGPFVIAVVVAGAIALVASRRPR